MSRALWWSKGEGGVLMSEVPQYLSSPTSPQRRIEPPLSIPLICTGARWSPATCGAHQGARKRRFAPALRAGWAAPGATYLHPGGNPGENLKSISHRCHPILVAFVWELTKETIYLPMGCLQGGQTCRGGPEQASSILLRSYPLRF